MSYSQFQVTPASVVDDHWWTIVVVVVGSSVCGSCRGDWAVAAIFEYCPLVDDVVSS